jgi:hypothetical protein
MDEQAAKGMIVERCPDAVPGHQNLVDAKLVRLVRDHGDANYLPLHDATGIEAAY